MSRENLRKSTDCSPFSPSDKKEWDKAEIPPWRGGAGPPQTPLRYG